MTEAVERMRSLSLAHDVEGWTAVQMRDITACVIEIDRLRADLASLIERHNNLHINAQRHRTEVETLRKDAERYHTVRRMSVPMFTDAFVLNRRTGKPFDEIIDDLRPFMFPKG